MSGTEAFLERLYRQDIRLAAENGGLAVDAPKGALTAPLREELGRRKAEVLEFLGRHGGRWTPPPAASAGVEIPAAPRDGALPASFAQERLWYFGRLMPESAAYNLHFGWRLRGPIDLEALARALDDVTARHEVLRTTFREEEGRVLLVVHPPRPWRVEPVVLAPGGGEAEAMAVLQREALRPFDLQDGPMVRVSLLRQAGDLHWLLVAYHHISGDGWSSAIFARELAALYSAHAGRRAAALPPLAIQYADYAHWQRTAFSRSRLVDALAWWKARLQDAPAASELPMDRPRPAMQDHGGATSLRVVPPEARDRLAALARARRTTLFVAILAAFQALLARQSGQDDVCVGVPVAGRDRSELEPLVGMFINTVVIRTRLAPGQPFEALLDAVRDEFLGAMAHRDAPFESVVREVGAPRNLARSPVFQVMVNMLNFPLGEMPRFHGLEAEPLPLFAFGQVQSKFDLTLYVHDDREGLHLSAVYDPALFDAARIDDLLGQAARLVEALGREPATAWDRVPLAAGMPALPDPLAPLPARACPDVVARARDHAQADPHRDAVVDARGALSRSELEALSNRLANHLVARGVGRGERVAILGARCTGLAWALLGVLKAGAAFVIVDPAYPRARTAQALALARPRAWIRLAEAPAAEGTPEADAAVVAIDWLAPASEPAGAWRGASPQPPAVAIDPDDLAYVAFTSGSSGTPKAIAGTHRPLAHFFEWHAAAGGLGPDDRFSVLSGLAHDPLLRDVLGALWVGATACMPDAARLAEPGYLGAWLARERVTVCHLTPAMAELSAIGVDPEPAPPLPALRRVAFGGETLRPATVELLRRRAPRARFVNFYGATETPQAMGYFEIDAGRELPPRVPVGRGIEGVQLLVLRGDGALAAVGELGEIHIRTPYLARGYWEDEALTRERFLPGPGGDPGDRMYRTGDLGRYRPDGTVELDGRADAQVKVRGFRVELGEIEAALRAHPEVADAAADLREPAAGGEPRLFAWAVARAGGPGAEPSALREHLARVLPDYMVPARLALVARIPLTPNGKVDRRALAEPAAPVSASRRAPAGATELALAAIWRDVLGAAEVGADDNFFDLGGHSLLATRVLSRLRSTLGVQLPLRALFQAPTLAGLAGIVDDARGGAEAESREDLAI